MSGMTKRPLPPEGERGRTVSSLAQGLPHRQPRRADGGQRGHGRQWPAAPLQRGEALVVLVEGLVGLLGAPHQERGLTGDAREPGQSAAVSSSRLRSCRRRCHTR